MLSFFPRGVLDEILNLIESVFEGFPSYFFNKALHTDALVVICSSLRDLGTQWAISLRIPKRSCKIVETLP